MDALIVLVSILPEGDDGGRVGDGWPASLLPARQWCWGVADVGTALPMSSIAPLVGYAPRWCAKPSKWMWSFIGECCRVMLNLLIWYLVNVKVSRHSCSFNARNRSPVATRSRLQ